MRITQTQEWVLAAVLIAYIAFTPGFQMVRSFLATPIGKAIGLAVIVYVWKYVSALLGLLLTINFVRCAGMREGLEMPEKACPPGFSPKADDPNKCSKKEGDAEIIVDAKSSSMPTEPAATGTTATPPMTTPTPPPPPPPPSTNPNGFTNYGGVESFIPRDEGAGAGGCSFSPI